MSRRRAFKQGIRVNEPPWATCHQACLAKSSEDSFALVKLLLDYGANRNNKNTHDRSPYDMATQRSKQPLELFDAKPL